MRMATLCETRQGLLHKDTLKLRFKFLNGFLQEEVFVEQPKGFVDAHHLNHVYRLKKALYGLKQAPRAWYKHLTLYLVDNGYSRGLQIKQMHDGIFVSQAKYAKSLVKKFGLENAKHCETPMSTTLKLSKDASGKDVEQSLYRGMIGSLLYLTSSTPDIYFSVGVYARYQASPKESHPITVKRIIWFVNGTSNHGIWYSFDTTPSLVGFSGADWVGNCDDRKSISGDCFFLGNNLVSWFCKKKNSISLSMAKAKYITADSACTQLMWVKQMLADYGLEQGTLTLFCNNMSAINISKNPVQYSRTKHIDIKHHFIRELVESKVIVLEHVGTNDQLTDLFTKPLYIIRYGNLSKSIGVCHLG
ncbi:hypothetical protein QYF36_021415 [Acer negundo]|nr:hypothetical protein QYF36_021415 [Acer negundo]